jgi:hypothetical protein
MTTAKLIETASNKGYSIARVKSGVYQYSKNGFEWTNINCGWNEFCKIILSL